jgi:haloalkane dehalogenase
MDRLRTPEVRFDDLPDFPYTPSYASVKDPNGGDDLRMAYLDEGPRDGDVVLLLHGEPSWSYLYRFMVPGLVARGRRVVAPDLIGFGRSDKPSLRAEYTYARHVEWVRELLFDQLDLRDVTLFAQDWGSLIGLRLVGEHPERFARVAIGNGGLPTGEEPLGEAFLMWQEYSQNTPDFHVGGIVSGGCVNRLAPEVVAAYDAPFPDDSFKEGARQFPLLVPTSPEDPAHEANVAAWATLAAFEKPFLCCYSDSDPITKGGDRKFLAVVPGTKGQPHVTIAGGGHFLQEERGPELAEVLNGFIDANPT